MLLDRISNRIDSWTSKNLSFAGRLQLLNSVLYGLQVYWSGIFILPKKVIKDMTQKFNRVLWNENDGNSAKAKVSWGDVCFPKKEGGLGLKCLEVWNWLSTLRHIWNLFACSGSIWVAWVQHYLLKGRSFWNVRIPQNCSWSWRKILSLRCIATDFIKFEVGNGKLIHLWLDNWHPFGPLYEKYGFRIIYDSQSCLESRLNSIIWNGNWRWKPARSKALVDIQSKLPEVPIRDVDKPFWTLSRRGVFVSAKTWEHMRQKKQEVNWWSVVWFPQAIPKQSFILWLAILNRLTTGESLVI